MCVFALPLFYFKRQSLFADTEGVSRNAFESFMDGKPLLHFRDILKIIFCLHLFCRGRVTRGYMDGRAIAVSFSKPKFNLNLNFVMVR